MPVYLYQGQHYTIATDDPAEAKRKIMASLPPEKGAMDYARDFGKATASLADTGINAVTGTLDQLAYPLARAFGRSPEQATAETTSPKDVIGSALGITQDPAYQQELSRRLMGGVGEGIQNYVVNPVSQATGLPTADVANMTGTAMAGVAPAVGRATAATAGAVGRGASAVGSGIKTAATAPVNVARGAFNAATGGETALAPLGKTYVTPEGANLFRQGRIDIATLESPQYTRPISELATGAVDRAALKVAGNQIPLAGQGAQAFGERVMSDYIANPYKAAVDIGLPLLTGGAVPPIYALGRGIQAGADMRLASKGFDPSLQQQIATAKTQQVFQQPQAPRLTYNPTAQGPVEPSTIYATPGGQAGTNLPQMGQAAMAEKYPAPAPVSPAEISQQAAAARIQQTTPVMSAEQQAVIDQVRARTAAKTEAERVARVAALQQRAQAAGGYTPPVAEAPVAQPTNTLASLRDRLTPQTPEQLAAVEAYNALSPADKAAQTRAKNNEDTFKRLKATVPRSEMSATEGKIFDMTQAERNAYEKKLQSELSTVKYPGDKKLIENALALIKQYRTE